MEKRKINKIKFTPTELKVLSAFANNITAYKALSKALNSSIKSIRIHIENIKVKIDAKTKEEISEFLTKCSRKEIKYLDHLFEIQFISNQFTTVATKIADTIAPLKPTCICSVLSQNPEPNLKIIANTIRTLGFKFHRSQISKFHPKTRKNPHTNDFHLYVSNNPHCLKMDNEEKSILICLGEHQPSYDGILFFDGNNVKELYHYLIKFLIKQYTIVEQLNKKQDLISNIKTFKNSLIAKKIIKLQSKEPSTNIKQSRNIWKTTTFSTLLMIVPLLFIAFYIVYQPNQQEITAETAIYNLPPKNQKFIGRKDIIKQIHTNLNSSNIGKTIQVVAGSGGVGKSQLLTEIAYRALRQNKYNVILWLNAHSRESMDNSYNKIANKLGINTSAQTPDSITKLVHEKLRNKHDINSILIVLDNVPNEQEIKQYLDKLQTQWFFDTNIDILISSRHRDWQSDTYVLDIFTPQEAKNFIKKELPYETDENIVVLAKLLNYYPLALDQAIGSIEQHTNITDYIKLYHSKQHLDQKTSEHFKQTINNVLDISLANIKEQAKEILYISSYLNSINIYLDFFDYLPIEDKLRAIRQLREYSLINIQNDRQAFKVHASLQEAVRQRIATDNQWLNKAIALSKKDIDDFDASDTNTWNKPRQWLFHIQTLYKYSEPNLDIANWLYQYGEAAKYFGLYELSRTLFLDSLEIKKQHYKSDNNINLVDTLDALSKIELTLDHYGKARMLAKQSLMIKENYYKTPNHIAYTDPLIILGKVEINRGNYNKAKEIFVNALNILEKHYQDPNNIKLINILNNIGYLELYFGYYELAQAVFQRILDIKNHHYQDPEHIGLSDTLNDLGLVELYLGNWRDSKKYHTKALEIRRKHYQNEEHISLARSLHNLGVTEWGLGNYEKSKELYMQALQTKQEHYQDKNHITLVTNLLGLGLSEYSQSNYEKAKYYLERDLAIRNSYYRNPNHVKLASSLHTLGIIDEALGNYDNALKNIAKSYDIRKAHYKNRLHNIMASEYSPVILWPRSIKSKNKLLAMKYYQDSLEITKKLFGKNHHFVARYHYLLGLTYEINNKYKQSIVQYQKALTLAEEILPTIKDPQIKKKFQENIKNVRSKLID
jgi:tetratricopeptide (TPR) repeat protein/DNA-binding CsgD family transcriptional regulator